MKNGFLIGIDVGGTKILGALVTPLGEVLATCKVPTPPRAGAREVVSIIKKTVQTLCAQEKINLKNILGIGVAVPGIVDNAGRVIVTPNLGLSGVDLKTTLQKAFSTAVTVGNDVNLGVLGEQWLGAGRKVKNIVGIFPGTGVGGGVIINGQFLTGIQGAAAEIGHMMIDPNGPVCTCGNTGCLEAVVGRWAMERDIRAAIKKGNKPRLKELNGASLKQIKSSVLAKALKAKDPVVTRVMSNAVETLAKTCVALNHIFNTEMFLFGGGVIEACGDFILPRVEKALKADPFFKNLQTPKVAASKLGDTAVVLGAAAMVRDTLSLRMSDCYPKVKVTPAGRVTINGKIVTKTLYIRADGKIKEPKDALGKSLGEKELADISKRGPDLLIVARAKGKNILVSLKGQQLLKKKNIRLEILPLAPAVRAFNASEERKAILFFS